MWTELVKQIDIWMMRWNGRLPRRNNSDGGGGEDDSDYDLNGELHDYQQCVKLVNNASLEWNNSEPKLKKMRPGYHWTRMSVQFVTKRKCFPKSLLYYFKRLRPLSEVRFIVYP